MMYLIRAVGCELQGVRQCARLDDALHDKPGILPSIDGIGAVLDYFYLVFAVIVLHFARGPYGNIHSDVVLVGVAERYCGVQAVRPQ